jgi:hypothetical protein
VKLRERVVNLLEDRGPMTAYRMSKVLKKGGSQVQAVCWQLHRKGIIFILSEEKSEWGNVKRRFWTTRVPT